MLYKEFLVSDVLQDVQPSQEEKIMFAERKNVDPAELYNGGEAGEAAEKEPAERSKQKLFFKGDTVKLISGELKNLEGVVEEADTTRKEVQVRVAVGDDSEVLLLKEEEIMKTFKTGAHVKIIAGAYSGETGTVVLVDEKDGESTGLRDRGERLRRQGDEGVRELHGNVGGGEQGPGERGGLRAVRPGGGGCAWGV